MKFLLGGVIGQAHYPSDATPAQIQVAAAWGFVPLDQTKFAMLISVPVDYSICRTVGIRFEWACT